MANALWCHAQLVNCDGVCVHGDKAARLYKTVHFTAALEGLDAKPWPADSFITNAKEVRGKETRQFDFTNIASGDEEVLHSD